MICIEKSEIGFCFFFFFGLDKTKLRDGPYNILIIYEYNNLDLDN